MAKIEAVQGKEASTTLSKGRARIKVPDLPTFDGTKKEELQGFLTQLRTHFMICGDEFDDESAKVLLAGACLRGIALEWFEPTQRDYLNNIHDEQRVETIQIFESFANFEDAISKVFGILDQRSQA
ncbi:hypothetical protein P885DRAFT_48141, partial [Corynascus similis CBS 632.67]